MRDLDAKDVGKVTPYADTMSFRPFPQILSLQLQLRRCNLSPQKEKPMRTKPSSRFTNTPPRDEVYFNHTFTQNCSRSAPVYRHLAWKATCTVSNPLGRQREKLFNRASGISRLSAKVKGKGPWRAAKRQLCTSFAHCSDNKVSQQKQNVAREFICICLLIYLPVYK